MARAFERPATIALPPEACGEGASLEGLYIPIPDPQPGGAVIAPPHPMMGGSMESPVVTELAHAAERARIPSLRFNWRGVGASAGRPSGETADADVDYLSALSFMSDSVSGPLLAAGYSFGAATALRMGALGERPPSERRAVRPPTRLVLVSPPTSMLDPDGVAAFPGEMLLLAGDRDQWVSIPELEAVAARARAAHLEVLEDCDHFLMQGLAQVRARTTEWLERFSSPPEA